MIGEVIKMKVKRGVVDEERATMKSLRRATTILSMTILATGLLAAVTKIAQAAEPRPWLCRDKPVFSSGQPMTYDASVRGGGSWTMTFMRFDPTGGHDGFTVFDSREINGQLSGTLERGQWYAVGMYREGGHWICAAQAQESHQFVAGIVRDLCYGASEGGCDVKMIVREAGQSVPRNPSTP
jgi:hypothetical protein